MEPREVLEALVAVVATLGELVAIMAGPDGDLLLAASPRSLHTALGTFIGHLRDTLHHPSVSSLGHRGVPSLGCALAALGATPGATWAHVRAAARAWRESVAALKKSWLGVAEEATELCDACRDTATATATTTAQARDLRDQATRWGTAMDNLVATAWRLPVALTKEEVASVVAVHEARVAAASDEVAMATKALEEAVVATSQAEAATRRGQRAKVAQELLRLLVAACDKATVFPLELLRRLGDIEATLEGTKEASPDVPEALVATVAEAERLWEASARLATRHLVGTLGDIRILLSRHPGGPGGPTVAERCQKAIEDIPRLLEGQ